MDSVLTHYQRLLGSSDYDIEDVGTEKLPFPCFHPNLYEELCSESYNHFKSQPAVLQLPADIYVVGDLHGNIRDLIRILANAGPPPTNRFLFLGDYVDRGEYSLEVITLLFALVLKYPEHVFLLRGNHEYEDINEVYGFKDQIYGITGSSVLWKRFNQAFEELPIAAVIDKQIFCVHGGLSPALTEVSIIQTKNEDFVEDLMWSDPSSTTKGFFPSTRGHGYFFGDVAIRNFLKRNNLKQIVRAHQCIKKGVSLFGNDTCVTVFSTCNYDGKDSNECGIIKYDKNCEFFAYNFASIKILRRCEAKFMNVGTDLRNIRHFLSLTSFQIGPSNPLIQLTGRVHRRMNRMPKDNRKSYTHANSSITIAKIFPEKNKAFEDY